MVWCKFGIGLKQYKRSCFQRWPEDAHMRMCLFDDERARAWQQMFRVMRIICWHHQLTCHHTTFKWYGLYYIILYCVVGAARRNDVMRVVCALLSFLFMMMSVKCVRPHLRISPVCWVNYSYVHCELWQ